MYPNVEFGSSIVSGWYLWLMLGLIVPMALSVYCKPENFIFSRREIFVLVCLLAAFGLLGAQLLFIALHWNSSFLKTGIWRMIMFRGGFAYFGSLAAMILVLWGYAALRKKSGIAIADYMAPFLMLSQAFVRMGCLYAGCCYGRPTNSIYGFVFKVVDDLPRYPTQAYEALLLLAIYIIARFVYIRKADTRGLTFFMCLLIYGIGRFFIEFLRIDSPQLFFGITLAQATCLSLAAFAWVMLMSGKIRRK